MSKSKSWLGLFAFLGVSLGGGALGAWATTQEIKGWYQTLAKPAWNPPASIFGPVWTTLYVMMAVSGWLVWRSQRMADSAVPLTLFATQLLLNFAWSWIFFRFHQIGWALVDIGLLWVAIVATTVAFFSKTQVAGWLMLPYLAWVTFAGALNFTIWRLNAV